MPKVRRMAARDAANRELAKPETVHALDEALIAQAAAAEHAKRLRQALALADDALRAASRREGVCDRAVAREAKNARARIGRMRATTPGQ